MVSSFSLVHSKLQNILGVQKDASSFVTACLLLGMNWTVSTNPWSADVIIMILFHLSLLVNKM